MKKYKQRLHEGNTLVVRIKNKYLKKLDKFLNGMDSFLVLRYNKLSGEELKFDPMAIDDGFEPPYPYFDIDEKI